jgi:hypothetical protein
MNYEYEYLNTTNTDENMKKMSDLLHSLFIIGLSVMFSSWITSFFDNKEIKMDLYEDGLEYESDSDSESEDAYENQYNDLFDSLVDLEHLTKNELIGLKNEYLSETTPKGNVVMYYNYNETDSNASSYHYYSDDRSIPFNFLDTVARKYVYTYRCPELYRHVKTKLEFESELEPEPDTETKTETPTQNVFATFKNYKTVSKSKPNSKSAMICKNRYTRMGNMDDYNKNQLKLQNPDVAIKPLTFSDFKKMV